MTDFQIASLILTLTAGLAYINARFLRLPSSIGLMAIALLGSLALIAIDASGAVELTPRIAHLLARIDFGHTLLHGMLGVLLFAGALHVDLQDLSAQKVTIVALAVGGTLLSTALVGVAIYLVFGGLGVDVGLVYCLLFGALISPTDPIAVLGILKSAGAPHRLEVKIAGESLFNDGIGVVVFTVLLAIAAGGEVSAGDVSLLFLREAIGGIAFGLAVGYVGFRLLRSIDEYTVEVLITLAMVLGGFVAAEALHVSAPIAAVVSGLLVGNQGRRLAMSDLTRQHLDTFWELLDQILNAVLFLLIGLEVTHLRVSTELAVVVAIAIPLVLAARLVSVGIPVLALRPFREFSPHAVMLLTWGGLRGGISVALALALPAGRERDVILVVTYGVVVFSILVQGLTMGRLVRALARRS
jgi:monovalent cation:H+ antiporter, CPA1 family